jgi:hypothetical protein
LNALAATATKQRKKVLMKDQAEDEQNQRAAYADVHSAELKSPAASTTARFIAAIFDVGTISTGRPTHGSLLRAGWKMVTPEIVLIGMRQKWKSERMGYPLAER